MLTAASCKVKPLLRFAEMLERLEEVIHEQRTTNIEFD